MAKRSRGNTETDAPKAKAPLVARGEHGKWLKGASPNPSGVPAFVKEMRDLLKEDAGAARKLLRTVIDDEAADMSHRIRASEIVLKFTLPMPKAKIEVTGPEGRALGGVDTASLLQAVRRLADEARTVDVEPREAAEVADDE